MFVKLEGTQPLEPDSFDRKSGPGGFPASVLHLPNGKSRWSHAPAHVTPRSIGDEVSASAVTSSAWCTLLVGGVGTAPSHPPGPRAPEDISPSWGAGTSSHSNGRMAQPLVSLLKALGLVLPSSGGQLPVTPSGGTLL